LARRAETGYKLKRITGDRKAAASQNEIIMFSHVTVGTADLARACIFYDATLAPLGITRVGSKYTGWAAWQRAGEDAKFWVGLPFNQTPAHPGNGWMVAFTAFTRRGVDEAYAAAMASGGRDEGPPGLRPHFVPNYYGAYVRDLDGNKIHFVCRAAE
jgi:catechol 2,3-dioxygenase-like lactoylglutathione lyase family enzyme